MMNGHFVERICCRTNERAPNRRDGNVNKAWTLKSIFVDHFDRFDALQHFLDDEDEDDQLNDFLLLRSL